MTRLESIQKAIIEGAIHRARLDLEVAREKPIQYPKSLGEIALNEWEDKIRHESTQVDTFLIELGWEPSIAEMSGQMNDLRLAMYRKNR